MIPSIASLQKSAAATAAGGNAAAAAAASSSAGSSGSATAGAASAADLNNRFLTLLVSQLRNQDPLNPMDNAQLTSQLAQISTVSGIDKLNTTLSSLAASLGAAQYLQAGNLVGHDVTVAGNQLALAGGAAQGAFNLSSAADSVTVTIRDAGGAVVRTLALGAVPAGVSGFAWDGQTNNGTAAHEGTYTFDVAATSGSGKVTADALMTGRVLGVVAGSNGGPTQLQLSGLGRFNLADVVEIN